MRKYAPGLYQVFGGALCNMGMGISIAAIENCVVQNLFCIVQHEERNEVIECL